jgi:hypothetical protein
MITRSFTAKPAAERTVMEEEQGEGAIETTEVYVFIIPEILGEPSDPSPNPSAKAEEKGVKRSRAAKILRKTFSQ